MASSERTDTDTNAATDATANANANAGSQLAGTGGGSASGAETAATPLEAARIICLMNAHYHAGREGFLDTVHRWFMFGVIALGAAALADLVPPAATAVDGQHGHFWLKAAFAAGSTLLGALDLTFDLSNRARSHALMKRRYFSLLADLKAGRKTPEEVEVCLEEFSADEEPPYRVLLYTCWNAAQETVFGKTADRYQVGIVGRLCKNFLRLHSITYPVVRGG